MKQIIKGNNRKGFTLVETMLSVFILVVMSTMLVNGFITTMGYSYQTAVYNKSAAMNYSICMDSTGRWNKKSNYLDGGREASVANNTVNFISSTLSFQTGPIYSAINDINVGVERKSTLGSVVPYGLPSMDPRYAPTDYGNTSYVDNRTTFFYYPKYCSNSGANAGEVIILKDTSVPGKTTYKWVAVPNSTNPGLYKEDSDTGRYVLNNNYNLQTANNIVTIAEIGTYNAIVINNTVNNTVGG